MIPPSHSLHSTDRDERADRSFYPALFVLLCVVAGWLAMLGVTVWEVLF